MLGPWKFYKGGMQVLDQIKCGLGVTTSKERSDGRTGEEGNRARIKWTADVDRGEKKQVKEQRSRRQILSLWGSPATIKKFREFTKKTRARAWGSINTGKDLEYGQFGGVSGYKSQQTRKCEGE